MPTNHQIPLSDVSLCLPEVSLVSSYVAMVREGFATGYPAELYRTPEDKIAQIDADHEAYIAELMAPPPATITLRDGSVVPCVPATTLWLLHKGEVVGASNLRHYLTPSLMDAAGNIGYGIKPSWHGRGLAKHLLKLTLDYARINLPDLDRVLLTVMEENKASVAVILANGGTLWKIAPCPFAPEKPYHYYWINL